MVEILQRSRAHDREDEKGENETERSGLSVWIMFWTIGGGDCNRAVKSLVP